MSEMIADLFEGQPLRNQSSRTGVPQTVGSVMSALHVEWLQSSGDQPIHIQSRKKPLHVCPRGASWQSLLRINPRPLNGTCQMPRTPSLLGTVAEKCP